MLAKSTAKFMVDCCCRLSELQLWICSQTLVVKVELVAAHNDDNTYAGTGAHRRVRCVHLRLHCAIMLRQCLHERLEALDALQRRRYQALHRDVRHAQRDARLPRQNDHLQSKQGRSNAWAKLFMAVPQLRAATP